MTAYNEAGTLEDTVREIERASEGRFADWEIVIVDDASKDATPRIADELPKKHPRCRIFHNETNLNLGGAYKRGVREARMEYVAWLPGDNAVPADLIQNITSRIGEADMVLSYLKDYKFRSFTRYLISRSYTISLNLLFGNRLRYYNGMSIFRRDALAQIEIKTNSFACFAEALIRLLRLKFTYVEEPYCSPQNRQGKSTALRMRNVIQVVSTILRLFWEVRICRLKPIVQNAEKKPLPVSKSA